MISIRNNKSLTLFSPGIAVAIVKEQNESEGGRHREAISQKGEEVIRVRKRMARTKKRTIEPGTPHAFCLHVENGKTPIAKFCINDYQCWHCAFDQWIEAMEERQKDRNGFSLTGDILAKAA